MAEARFRIRKGLAIGRSKPPADPSIRAALPTRIALIGADYPGLRPAFEVAEGDTVTRGQVLFRDRKHREVAVTAPMAGRVTGLDYGPRRTLALLTIERTAEPSETGTPNITTTRETLLASGLWPAFRTRPYGYIPGPDDHPQAIVVNAVRTNPAAPDPRLVIADALDAFAEGLRRLTELTDGPVFLAREPGAPLTAPIDGVQDATFTGTSAAGLSGTQINRLHRAGPDRQVWSIGYQDVTAIGQLFQTGTPPGDRIVAITGPLARAPALIRTRLGADLRQLAAGHITQGTPCRLLSGDATFGAEAAFLRRADDQITLAPPARPTRGWRSALTRHAAITPTARLDRALALDIHAVPLMRALAIGDTETAERLGCLELIEEDVAALTALCTSGADYPRLLREVLDQLAEEAA
ncbi:hypothetical protein AADZ90_016960 [Aestuariibius sp. 2305UL40-4]|uniref:hypothetical protein n=1 Tax=Aestuariibius violaceus TaxID=3234132 RepID=UPI00345E4664